MKTISLKVLENRDYKITIHCYIPKRGKPTYKYHFEEFIFGAFNNIRIKNTLEDIGEVLNEYNYKAINTNTKKYINFQSKINKEVNK